MKITGKVRVTKIFQNQSHPYTSMIELEGIETKEVINRIFNESYQTNSEVIVGEISDQSIMVTKLPPANVNSNIDESFSRQEFIKKHSVFFQNIFEAATDDIERIVKLFEDRGFSYMTSRQIDFFCPCSKDRMLLNLKGLYANDIEHLFDGKDRVEIKCDYCRKEYVITKPEIISN
jgi:molecular chaperone Hsp33